MIDAYPLQWPLGYKRTKNRVRSNFKQTMDKVQRFLHEEVRRLGGRGLVVSTNLPIRKDGMLYSDWMSRRIDDPGVAIYFKYKEKDISMCCDQYSGVWENIYALAKGIEALRSMERWGVSDFLDRAFNGFTALPENTQVEKMWWEVLLVSQFASEEEIKTAYRSLAKQFHPDINNDNPELFIRIQKAYEEGLNSFIK